ncbi:hypothetical protein [Silvimonas soli]|uniref:hypothetical protein n=1 Tax=Silvimonas soli TaxID=2980100 RepID=UPI0024B33B43|nr:hypothetical protein [Silvimonas soli]
MSDTISIPLCAMKRFTLLSVEGDRVEKNSTTSSQGNFSLNQEAEVEISGEGRFLLRLTVRCEATSIPEDGEASVRQFTLLSKFLASYYPIQTELTKEQAAELAKSESFAAYLTSIASPMVAREIESILQSFRLNVPIPMDFPWRTASGRPKSGTKRGNSKKKPQATINEV